ncbi:ankyrin repeat domain-containing protein, partial [Klebsiella pneumoniae]|nr:ankyrin repeat domain-containing protein [Klebsiella pneumoniae]
VCVVGKMRDLILQLSKSSIYSTKPPLHVKVAFYFPEIISLNTLASGKNDKAY